jgi:hypothetical protein
VTGMGVTIMQAQAEYPVVLVIQGMNCYLVNRSDKQIRRLLFRAGTIFCTKAGQRRRQVLDLPAWSFRETGESAPDPFL